MLLRHSFPNIFDISAQGKLLLEVHTITTASMPELERGLGRIQGALDQVSNEAERDHGLRDQPRAHISEVEPTTDEATTPVSESGGSESPRHANIDAFDIRNPVACNDAVLVQATLPVKCRLDCTSQRHFQATDYCSPSWLKPVLGSIFLSYQDHPSLGHGKCNQTTCCRSQTQGHLSYYFPAWLWRRTISLSVSAWSLNRSGASLHLTVSRLLSAKNRIWADLNRSPVHIVIFEVRASALLPSDRIEYGMSLLSVRAADSNRRYNERLIHVNFVEGHS